MALLGYKPAPIPNVDATDAPACRLLPHHQTRWHRANWVVFFLFLVRILGAPSIRAQQTAASLEYQVKAAYLLNFTKFVEWPSAAFRAPDAPIMICVIGNDPFGPTLDRTVAGESASGRAVQVQRLVPEGNLTACHVVFIGRSEQEGSVRILSDLRGSSVLTVSDMSGFAERGGMIEFVIQEGKVRFYIQAAAARAVGLRLSSRLLRLAIATRGPRG